MNEKFPSCFSWYYDPIIKLADNEISELQKSDYFKQYLHTDYWKSVRNKFFEKFDKICHECPSGTENNTIQLHHKGYDLDSHNTDLHKLIFGRERYCDLIPLCEKHHQTKHLHTETGDRVTSSTMENADVRYIGFFIGKYAGKKQAEIHIALTVKKGIKADRSRHLGQPQVNRETWYSILDYEATTIPLTAAYKLAEYYDGYTQEFKRQLLIDNGVSEKDIDACLKAGFVPKNKNFEDYYDLLEETN